MSSQDECQHHNKEVPYSSWKNYKDIDLGYIKTNNVRLYYFGLGFIQLKLNDTFRLHFYSEELPPITEDIHNHRYDFTSQILKGNITNYIYSISNGSDYLITNESCNPDIQAPPEKKFCNAALAAQKTFSQGDKYSVTHDEFHRVEAANCITLLSRGGYKKEFAQVVYPTAQDPVCPFSKKIPDGELWRIIEEML